MEDLPPPRHGCLTAFLLLAIIGNAVAALIISLAIARLRQTGLHPDTNKIGILAICAFGNVIFAVGLFRWQMWGYHGLVITTIIGFVTNLSLGYSLEKSFGGFLGIVLLTWVLHMGGGNKAWPHLK